jgi:uncharacterized protein YjdB
MRTQIISSMFALALITGCQAKVATVEVSPAKIELGDEKASETVTFAAKDAKGGAIEKAQGAWTSSDPKVATVDATGKITAVGSGNTVIMAKVGEISGQSNVTVTMVKAVKAEPATLEVQVGGEAKKLTATFANERGEAVKVEKAVTFTVKDAAIATVGADGTVTAVAPGATEVEIAAGELKTTAAITVTAAAAPADAAKIQ